MNTKDFDESLGTFDKEPEGGVFTPALARLQAAGGDQSEGDAVAHRSATKQYMLVGGVVLAGIATLVFLRSQGVGADLVFGQDEVKIDYPIDAPNNVNTEQRQRRVLESLATSGEIAQVPAEDIEQNPFQLKNITSTGEEISEADSKANAKPAGPSPAQLRLQELDRLAATLELNTVISGRISLARINGKTYRLGDTVADEFRIMAINPDRTVEIKADETVYILEMDSR